MPEFLDIQRLQRVHGTLSPSESMDVSVASAGDSASTVLCDYFRGLIPKGVKSVLVSNYSKSKNDRYAMQLDLKGLTIKLDVDPVKVIRFDLGTGEAFVNSRPMAQEQFVRYYQKIQGDLRANRADYFEEKVG